MATAPADGLAAKKKSLRAQEQDTPENRQRREVWREQIKRIDPRQCVFGDESGATTEMTRRYGRAPRGEWVREATPAGHWSTLTLLGAMSTEGLLATMTVESPTDGDVFLAYLEHVLCPRLEPGPIVVLDNLGRIKFRESENSSRPPEPNCGTCRRTRPTSTPLHTAGGR